MSSNVKTYLKEITDSYISLQMSLFLELFLKSDNEEKKFISNAQLLLGLNDLDLIFDTGQRYILRNEYVMEGLKMSAEIPSLGPLGEVAIIQSFAYIASRMRELIRARSGFKDFIRIYLTHIKSDPDLFFSIINLIRNISSHGSLSKNYLLKKADFESRKKYQKIKQIDFIANIGPNQKFEISIDLDDLIEGYSFSKLFDGYKMFMFIELCMNIRHFYENPKT